MINMELKEAKYVSMIILFAANVFMTLIGICLQRFFLQRHGNVLSFAQRIISCLTSGILLGTLLMLILPNSLGLAANQWPHMNMGYILVGLGFFLICIIEESIKLYERYSSNKQAKTEKEQLIDSFSLCNHDGQLTRLVTLVFALGVHYFFSGILIGGHTQDATSLWILLGAICSHMALIAFSVTLRLLIDHQNYLRVFTSMCIWSFMGPLGVLLSLLISSDSTELNYINGILQCLSAGTFVYITFIDMIHGDLIKIMANLLRKGNRTEPAAPPAPTRAPAAPAGGSSNANKLDDGAVNPWDAAQIWIESINKEASTRKQWADVHGWMAEYDPKGNIKPKRPPIENSTRFSDTVPNSRGHDYGWRLQSTLGQEIQNLQVRFDEQYKKRVPKEILGYD
ncbi:unnamed protein product [Adineta ricciae]|uniref:Uncharacterized protein n=1 Tax=Adineta ricciae TaxID=249248 RepID=A0A814A1B5_ADIRI|nr:unnamed protein product [Adineta ricciae]